MNIRDFFVPSLYRHRRCFFLIFASGSICSTCRRRRRRCLLEINPS